MKVLLGICLLLTNVLTGSIVEADTASARSIKLRLGYNSVKILPNGCVASLWATGHLSQPMISRFVEDHINNEVDHSQINSPLMAAVARNQFDEVRSLINQNVDLDETNLAGCTAMIWSAGLGHSKIANTLINAGAEISQRDAAGRTPLMLASMAGLTSTVQELIDQGADVNAAQDGGINEVGQTPLINAVSRAGNTEVLKILIDNGADLNASNEHGKTALMKAAWYGHLDSVKLLLDAGADADMTSKSGHQAIDFARHRKHRSVVTFFEDR